LVHAVCKAHKDQKVFPEKKVNKVMLDRKDPWVHRDQKVTKETREIVENGDQSANKVQSDQKDHRVLLVSKVLLVPRVIPEL
jgi:hypothetical protein